MKESRDAAPGRIPALDGIRGLAILVVVVHNASWILGPSRHFSLKVLGLLTSTGWVGVQLFFVLSGFLITGILIDTRSSSRFFRNFYIRRFLRIFPLYYVFLGLAFGIAPAFADPTWVAMVRRDQVWYWAYLSNWAGPFGHSILGLPHFWSLAVEEQFYLVWPFIVYALSRRRLAVLCVTTIAVTPLIRWSLDLAGLPQNAAYEFTVARWDALAGGGLLALMMVDEAGRAWLRRWMSRLGQLAVAALAIVVILTRGFDSENLVVQVLGQSITVVLFVWLVHIGATTAVGDQGAGSRFLQARWLRSLGKYSYAIYVIHYPIHTIALHYLRDAVNGPDTLWRMLRWASYVLAIAALSVSAALASWYGLEKRFLDLKQRIAPRPQELPVGPASVPNVAVRSRPS